MENLMRLYKEKIESLKNKTIEEIQKAKNQPEGEFIFILTGKMLAYDICLKELELMENYYNESKLNK